MFPIWCVIEPTKLSVFPLSSSRCSSLCFSIPVKNQVTGSINASWWGHDTLPKLNYEGSVKLENYILYIGRKWVSPPYNVDGWRLDVAADLGQTNEYNHEFWKMPPPPVIIGIIRPFLFSVLQEMKIITVRTARSYIRARLIILLVLSAVF